MITRSSSKRLPAEVTAVTARVVALPALIERMHGHLSLVRWNG